MARTHVPFYRYFLLIMILAWGLCASAQDRQSGTEVPTMRDAYAKHYRQADGTMQAVISAGRVHYQDANGHWQDIHTQLTPSNAPGMAYENTTNAIACAFPAAAGTAQGSVIDAGEGLTLQMGMDLKLEAFAADGSLLGVIEHASSSNAAAGSAANAVEYPGVFSNATNTYEVHRAKVKNNLILHNPFNGLPAMTAYVGFSEIIALPSGVEVIANGEVVHQCTYTGGAIQFISAGSDESLQIPVPEIYELNNPSACVNPTGQYEIAYRIEPLGNKRYKLTTLTPLAWLADGARNYPVVVDPTVALSGSWGGWQRNLNGGDYHDADPSNEVYVNHSVGSQQFQFRAYVQWSIASIPVNVDIDNTEVRMHLIQAQINSVQENIKINQIEGNYGPYGAYDAAVFTDLGDVNYLNFSCSSAPADYGYYDLGAVADEDLSGQLGANNFQVGITIGTLNDTWKKFASDSSKLRVTYEACTSPIVATASAPSNAFGFEVDCFGDSTGSISASATGGGSSYVYVWGGPGGYIDTVQNPAGLGAGDYILTVYSGSVCPDTVHIHLDQPSELAVSIDSISTFLGGNNISCFDASDGMIEINISGGTPSYSVTWAGPNGFTASAWSISNLPAGNYQLEINDTSSCERSENVLLTQPFELLTSINIHTDAFCEGDSNGFAQASAAGGTTPYAYAWSDHPSTANSANSLASATTYVVTVSDANGCEDTALVYIDFEHPNPLVDLGPADTGLCEGGSLILNAGTGGSSYLWNDASTGQLLQVNALGTYAVTVTTTFGCEASDTIMVDTIYALPTPNLGPNVQAIGSETLDAGAGYFAYLWNTNDTTQTYVTYLSGTYTVTVTDAHGCQGEDEVKVVIWPVGIGSPQTSFISLFPNPANDHLLAQWSDQQSVQQITVVNALGQIVYTAAPAGISGISASIPTASWSEGTYFLILETEVSGSESLETEVSGTEASGVGFPKHLSIPFVIQH